MKIIYISTLTSKVKLDKIIKESKSKPLQSIQKFHRLICEGIVKNDVKIKTYSSIPMSQKISKKLCWFEKKEIENGVEYNYIPFINLKILRQICTFFGISFILIKECMKEKKEKIFICDILNTTISSTTLILSKIFEFKCIAIVTDLPRDIGTKRNISTKINETLQSKYDGYVILTEEMNKIVNPKSKPFVVIEGIVEDSKENNAHKKYKEKVLMYAGGLYERYGVKSLIEAFLKIDNSNIQLHLYGSGELETYIKEIKDNRIKFFGVVTNDQIIEEEKKVTMLVNPRFTNEEYTKYSFPSKNMEYMSSGTPMVTTKLPGMPKEYYEHIYVFEDETVDGMKNTIEYILKKDVEELEQKGKNAKEFVVKNKNNKVQAKKIVRFLGET